MYTTEVSSFQGRSLGGQNGGVQKVGIEWLHCILISTHFPTDFLPVPCWAV